MMYTKHNGQEVELYGDEIYSKCHKCGAEIQVDIDLLTNILADGGDFSSGVSHVECELVPPNLTLVKG